MAGSPLSRDGRSAPAQSRVFRAATSARNQLPQVTRMIAVSARALAFWTAIALPVLNLTLLARGLSTPSETVSFLVLLAANLIALLVGHPHRSD